MIYDENKKSPRLKRELFTTPTAEYRATPFWAWNCDLERDELLRQIDVFEEMGLGGFHMHVRTGMSTEYLSEEFMSLIKDCTEHAKEKGMLSWLYDEDRWPSGMAGGIVTKDHSLRQRYLRFTANPERKLGADDILLATFDIVLDENGCLKSYERIADGDTPKGRAWRVIREVAVDSPRYNLQSYVDTLNPKAIDKFIELTYTAYEKAVGEHFGAAVPAMFTDEPQFTRKSYLSSPFANEDVIMPWTDDLDRSFSEEYGYSLLPHLPELVWELPDGKPSLARYRYHDHSCERFVEAFADRCGAWCDAHGIALTGHMMAESTLRDQTGAVGEAMRSYRSFGIPGIDMLCGFYEYTTAKQCQSAVRQYGRVGMLSELYGVTGWDFDFRGHKLHGDWQAALGVTVRVPHLSWVSMHGNAKRDYPGSIHYQSSWYKEYSYVEDHFARLNTALTRGVPVVKVGVIHPIESYWLCCGPESQTGLKRAELEDNFISLTDYLCRGSVDFDFISESLLPSLCEKGGAPLKVGKMSYDAIVVPPLITLRSSTLERLEEFRAAGGKLIFIGNAPMLENAETSERPRRLYETSERISFSRSALLSSLEDSRTIEIRHPNGKLSEDLLYQLRKDTHGSWLFLAHARAPKCKDVSTCKRYDVRVHGRYTPSLWDTQSGEVRATDFRYDGGDTLISLFLYDYDSALLFLEDGEKEPLARKGNGRSIELCTSPERVAYTLSEPNVLLLDKARYALEGEELCEEEEILRLDSKLRRRLGLPLRMSSVAQPWVIEKKPPRWRVTLEFCFESEIDVASPMLALEDGESAEIIFNGEKVEYRDLGFYTDVSIRKTALPPIRKGKNILRVTLPFDERTDVECCYILGDFGTRVSGRHATITSLPETLCFDRLDSQGLCFYGGCVSYDIPLELNEEADVSLCTMHYRAAVMTVEVDGERVDTIAYPPYIARLGRLSKGSHTVRINAYISRHNCFGAIHCADESLVWFGPEWWRTEGSSWTYEYRLLPEGILSTPIFYKK